MNKTNRKKLLEPNGAVAANIRVFVAPTNTLPTRDVERIKERWNEDEVNAEAKSRTYGISLRPYHIVHLLCIRKTLMNVQHRGGNEINEPRREDTS